MMAVRGRVLIIEDDRAICNFMRRVLEANGYEALAAYTGREGLSMLTSHCPDVVILDLGLPDMEGMQVLTELRKWSLMPVVVVSARTDESEKVRMLDASADDYITKPFSLRELMARVKANIRRRNLDANANSATRTAGGLSLDEAGFVAFKHGKALDLSQKEFDLLRLLMASPGKVFSREALMEKVWSYDYYGDTRTVDVMVRRLREKLEDDPGSPTYILTRRGVGYYFSDEV